MLRRVVLDDQDADAYVSAGPEASSVDAVDDTAFEEQLDIDAHEAFVCEVERLRVEGWSTARIALDLHATEDEVRAACAEDWQLDESESGRFDKPEHVYGIELDDEL